MARNLAVRFVPVCPAHFPDGETVRVTGSNGSTLEIRYLDSGNRAEVYLNGEFIETFDSSFAYLNWLAGN